MNDIKSIELLEPTLSCEPPAPARLHMQPAVEGRYMLLTDHIAAIKKPIQALAKISNMCKLNISIGRKLDGSEIAYIVWEATRLNSLELNEILDDEDKI